MTDGPGDWEVRRHEAIDSTQSEARRRLEAGESLDRVAFAADVQRGGVGRFGRAFESPLGGAWQTLAIADPSGARSDGRLAPALAVALAENFGAAGRPLRVKWPNDLFRGGRKCGGILSERVRGHLLIGVGLNAANVPPPGFARLDLAPEEVRERVRVALDSVLAAWPPDDLPARWARHDLLRGRTVTIGDARGRVLGIASDAALLLHDEHGREVRVRSGSVAEIDPPVPWTPAE